jgi:hypothetical protein
VCGFFANDVFTAYEKREFPCSVACDDVGLYSISIYIRSVNHTGNFLSMNKLRFLLFNESPVTHSKYPQDHPPTGGYFIIIVWVVLYIIEAHILEVLKTCTLLKC